ncbi:condensation domain-containing protein [Chitinophaga costaii]|uniref:condensation domain-containing protein n=1 Tax=Chitinophaga costaii TaxID=1335309 RepID=UPI003743BD1D
MLHELSGTDTIITGAPAAGREMPELQEMPGLFVNTIVLKRPVDTAKSFSQLVAETMEVLTAELE